MKKVKLIVTSLCFLSLVGCKSIVNDYTPAELDTLDIKLAGEGMMSGSSSYDTIDGYVWTCPKANPRVSVEVKDRKAKTTLEFQGRYFRDESEVTDHGTTFSTNEYFDYNLNLKIDLKRQLAKVSVSNKTSVDSGCRSQPIDLTVVEG
jgi:hypothetical protein